MNSGLYARAGASATATAAAWANRLDWPITNVSNVYFSFNRVLDVCGCAGLVNGCCAGCCLPLKVGQISWTAASASPSSSTSPSASDSVTSSAAVRSSTAGGTATNGTVTPTGSVGGPSTIGCTGGV